jgi:hypothetical protein
MEPILLQKSLPTFLALGLFFWGLTSPMGPLAEGAGGPVLGGPCEYKIYEGRAEIMAIRPVRSPGDPRTTFEVTYSFQPEAPITEPFAQTEGRTFLLTMKNGTFPDQRFLKKYRIEPGRVFDCALKVITRGTCTPTLFEFSGIDLGDYGTR